MSPVVLLIALSVILMLTGCDVKKPQAANQENKIAEKHSFFSDASFEDFQFLLGVNGGDDGMLILLPPTVEKCMTTVKLCGDFCGHPAYLKIVSMGMNDYSGNRSIHKVPIYENRAVVVGSPVHLEVKEWLNEKKTWFKNYFGEEWRLISVAPSSHSERMKRIGLMGPGDYYVFHDEKGRFHTQLVLDSGMIWEYQLKND